MIFQLIQKKGVFLGIEKFQTIQNTLVMEFLPRFGHKSQVDKTVADKFGKLRAVQVLVTVFVKHIENNSKSIFCNRKIPRHDGVVVFGEQSIGRRFFLTLLQKYFPIFFIQNRFHIFLQKNIFLEFFFVKQTVTGFVVSLLRRHVGLCDKFGQSLRE